MRILKPTPLTLMHGPLDIDGRVVLIVAVGVMFDFARNAAEQEQTFWQIFPKAPGSTGILDEMRPKTRGEWLVLGSAYAPNKKPAPAVGAKACVGNAKKEIWAVGNRVWDNGIPSAPVPFLEMPISWENAFGGEGFAQNPVGKGFKPIKTDNGEVHPLPNVELAGKLITSPREKTRPAGFGAIDPSLPDRVSKAGTYDKKWLDTRYPSFPEDFDPTHFNMAPEDQWIEGLHFEPGVTFSFENMHPDKRVVQGILPNLRARLFITRNDDDGKMHDVSLRCDTLWFLPHIEKVIMMFRGTVEVEDEMLEQLVDMMPALEWGDRPKPMSHYAKVRADRLDKKLGSLFALRDADLMPEDLPILGSDLVNELDELLGKEGLIRKNMARQVEKKLAAMRAELEANGIDPEKYVPQLPPDPPPPAKGDVAAHQMALQQQAAELTAIGQKKLADVLKEVEETCQKEGLDFEEIKRKAQRQASGPPKFRAKDEMEKLQDMATLAANAGIPISGVNEKLSDPRFYEKLQAAERAIRDMYRRGVHLMPPAFAKDDAEPARLRAAVLDALATDKDLHDWDLTCADLAGIDFSGANLVGTFFEGANLEGCRFRGANLERSVLARARMARADFEGCNMTGTNLGEAHLDDTRFCKANLSGATFYKSRLVRTDLTGVRLDKADFAEAVMERPVMLGLEAKETIFSRADFSGFDFRGSRFEHCTFMDVKFDKANFSGANLTSSGFMDVSGVEASFVGAVMKNVRFARIEKGTKFPRAQFVGTDLSTANLRGAELIGASFKDAILNQADFSSCKLAGANFEGARAVESRFVKADLTDANLDRTDFMNALFTRAILRGARFEEANMFRADAAAAKGDKRTSFRGANVNQVRFVRNQENRG
ncbi:MAG TPA: DUF2169 domain-containing protein [Polyangium sp.]|nr:DUF2169 domain-containing protein [Polyangium sp.]